MNKNWIIYNAQLWEEKDLFSSDQWNSKNRSFRYGDGCFESFLWHNEQVPLWNFHFDRLQSTLGVLNIEWPDLSSAAIYSQIKLLAKKYNSRSLRFRLQVWRSKAGTYKPESNSANWLLEAVEIDNISWKLNKTGLTLGVFKEIPLYFSKLSSLKTNNALPYILASNFAKSNLLDDAILINTQNGIVEVTSSNIFFQQNNILFTPHLNQACLNGVMRKTIIEICKKYKIKVKETIISLEQIENYDSCFICNSIRGLNWISTIEHINFQKPELDFILSDLQKTLNN